MMILLVFCKPCKQFYILQSFSRLYVDENELLDFQDCSTLWQNDTVTRCFWKLTNELGKSALPEEITGMGLDYFSLFIISAQSDSQKLRSLLKTISTCYFALCSKAVRLSSIKTVRHNFEILPTLIYYCKGYLT